MYLTNVFWTLNIPNIVLRCCIAPSRIWPHRIQRYSERSRVAVLFLIFLFGFTASAVAQSNDEFIGTIARMKGAVAAITCMNPPQQFSVHGAAFFCRT